MSSLKLVVSYLLASVLVLGAADNALATERAAPRTTIRYKLGFMVGRMLRTLGVKFAQSEAKVAEDPAAERKSAMKLDVRPTATPRMLNPAWMSSQMNMGFAPAWQQRHLAARARAQAQREELDVHTAINGHGHDR